MDTATRQQIAESLRGREVRSIANADLELREIDGEIRASGYASVTNTPYDMGAYEETISRGAFSKTLSENPDVVLLLNHEGLPLSRTANGTLRLGEDDSVWLGFVGHRCDHAPPAIGTSARYTTSASKVANSANRYRIENANSLRVARSDWLRSRRR